jgi:hypothetical protein
VSSSFTITAAAASKLAFVQAPPANPFVNTTISPAVTVQIQDAYGNSVSSTGVTVTMAATGGSLSGGSTTTNASGLATFSALKFGNSALNVTMTASSSGLTSITSSTLNVTVNVSSTANTLTDTATDSGAGVGSVSYYYCAGWSGACTSSSGTLIGSGSNAANGFQASWGSRPAAGAYRVIAVASDKVNNIGGASSSTPVTVTS